MVTAALGIRSKEKLAKELGVGRTKLHYIETGVSVADEQFIQSLERLEEKARALGKQTVHSNLQEEPLPYRTRGIRRIPVISWAHAGDAASYEELPKHWQDYVASDVKDPQAFAAILEGDSMRATTPGLSFEPGDLIITQPSEQAYSGCFVMAKFTNDGIIFRRFEAAGDKIRLVPLNERYPVTLHERSEFHWMYPVSDRITRLWKR